MFPIAIVRRRLSALAVGSAGRSRSGTATYNNVTMRTVAYSTTPQQQQQQPQSQQHQEQKVALVMGVANHRSIAWACVESFRRQNYDVIVTYQTTDSSSDSSGTSKKVAAMDKLILANSNSGSGSSGSIHALPCNVETDLPKLFQEHIPDLLQKNNFSTSSSDDTFLDTIVHSIAYAPFATHAQNNNLSEASLANFQLAHQISTYSLLETARYAKSIMNSTTGIESGTGGASITALSYLGANRALSNYSLMGPAKASLEACVRGLAVELGSFALSPAVPLSSPSTTAAAAEEEATTASVATDHHSNTHSIRVNAVSAGPLRTLSSRGIPQFTDLWQHVQEKSPLKRNVTHQEVADTVRFLASEGTGITGQVLYVDAGYNSVVPV